jgi:hypothetical protein
MLRTESDSVQPRSEPVTVLLLCCCAVSADAALLRDVQVHYGACLCGHTIYGGERKVTMGLLALLIAACSEIEPHHEHTRLAQEVFSKEKHAL